MKYGVSQGYVLGPLLLILFINDSHKAFEFSIIHHLISSQILRVVTLQDDLQWNSHLMKLGEKVSRSIDLLSKIRFYVPKHNLKTNNVPFIFSLSDYDTLPAP